MYEYCPVVIGIEEIQRFIREGKLYSGQKKKKSCRFVRDDTFLKISGFQYSHDTCTHFNRSSSCLVFFSHFIHTLIYSLCVYIFIYTVIERKKRKNK